jgi:putative FmdB family regulatory protein
MPIYAYKCTSCGHAKDVLQKMSDAPLSVCPACGQASFQKQLTAAGFQLKGSGWYATDFRNGNTGAAPAAGKGEGEGKGEEVKGAEGKGSGEATSPTKPAEGAGSAPAGTSPRTSAASPAAAPAAAPASSPSSPSSTS